jgi:hypothetical protein
MGILWEFPVENVLYELETHWPWKRGIIVVMVTARILPFQIEKMKLPPPPPPTQ